MHRKLSRGWNSWAALAAEHGGGHGGGAVGFAAAGERVVLVSDAFSGKRPVARHQAVYAALAEELAGPVHALALHTYDPAEWRERQGESPASPACLGGSKAEGGAV